MKTKAITLKKFQEALRKSLVPIPNNKKQTISI